MGIFQITRQSVKMQKPKIAETQTIWYHIVPHNPNPNPNPIIILAHNTKDV